VRQAGSFVRTGLLSSDDELEEASQENEMLFGQKKANHKGQAPLCGALFCLHAWVDARGRPSSCCGERLTADAIGSGLSMRRTFG
jgi:hypothetical protein